MPLKPVEIELVYKSKVKPSDRPQIKKSDDTFRFLLQTWDQNKLDLQEQFKVVLLNRANRILGMCDLSTGGLTGTVADPRLIFALALKSGACSIILAHNHPSGNLQPAVSDKELTNKIVQAGKLFDITVLDHVIVTRYGYFSFADEGLI